ncbi:unnamed protein product [Paramecium primaurelia]|uniref:Uncharacterized protein n=1 Tax=Paramecium primaurelia TaxID=5886 RepID=A0A8S1NE23_PARPR|nr:unnamed protein product [Paramecium primaurelia]
MKKIDNNIFSILVNLKFRHCVYWKLIRKEVEYNIENSFNISIARFLKNTFQCIHNLSSLIFDTSFLFIIFIQVQLTISVNDLQIGICLNKIFITTQNMQDV